MLVIRCLKWRIRRQLPDDSELMLRALTFIAGRVDAAIMRAIHLPIAMMFLSCISVCFGQTVIIRLVNVENERPVKNRRVYISGIFGTTAPEKDEQLKLVIKPIRPELNLVTDANGVAQFELPKPVPAYFYVRAMLSGPHWDCTCLVRVSTEEVMQEGFVARSPYAERKPATTSNQPKPGEVRFDIRPLPWSVRILWPLVKG